MTQEGTVVNGAIVFDGPLPFPEGTRVRVEPAEDAADDFDPATAGPFEYPHPFATYDRERELALLRERIGDMKAGVPGIPLKEAMDSIRASLNLPPVEPESV